MFPHSGTGPWPTLKLAGQTDRRQRVAELLARETEALRTARDSRTEAARLSDGDPAMFAAGLSGWTRLKVGMNIDTGRTEMEIKLGKGAVTVIGCGPDFAAAEREAIELARELEATRAA